MLSYDQLPKERRRHLSTMNVVESSSASARLCTTAAQRFKKVERATAIIWRLLLIAEKRFPMLNAPRQRRDVLRAVRYTDGIRALAVPTIRKAVA